ACATSATHCSLGTRSRCSRRGARERPDVAETRSEPTSARTCPVMRTSGWRIRSPRTRSAPPGRRTCAWTAHAGAWSASSHAWSRTPPDRRGRYAEVDEPVLRIEGDAMSEAILLSVSEGMARLTLNRPSRLNAFNADLAHAWRDAATEVTTRQDVGAILIDGAGPSFCE